MAERESGLMTGSPIACNLAALTDSARLRHLELARRLKAAIANVHEIEEGFRFEVRPTMSASELLEWIDGERRCCPFLDFQLNLGREGGQRQLQLTGREGVKPLLVSEFALAQHLGQDAS